MRKYYNRFPLPRRDGADIYVIMPNGERVDITAHDAFLEAEAWLKVVGGAAVYQETNVVPRLKDELATPNARALHIRRHSEQ